MVGLLKAELNVWEVEAVQVDERPGLSFYIVMDVVNRYEAFNPTTIILWNGARVSK